MPFHGILLHPEDDLSQREGCPLREEPEETSY